MIKRSHLIYVFNPLHLHYEKLYYPVKKATEPTWLARILSPTKNESKIAEIKVGFEYLFSVIEHDCPPLRCDGKCRKWALDLG